MKKRMNSPPKSFRGQANYLAKKLEKTPKITEADLTDQAKKLVDSGRGSQVGNGLNTPDGWPAIFGDEGEVAANAAVKTASVAAAVANDPNADGDNDAPPENDPTDPSKDAIIIAPPSDWSDEAKSYFDDLPAIVKNAIAEHEHKMTGKLSEQSQSIDDQLKAMNDIIGKLIDHGAVMDPIIRDGIKTDWAELAQSDPDAHAAKWSQFQQRMVLLQELDAQHKVAAQHRMRQQGEQNRQALIQKLPDWQDEAKRKQMVDSLTRYASEWGFKSDDKALINDHRVLLMALDAAKYRDQQKSVNSLPQKRVGQLPSSPSEAATLRGANSLPPSLKPGRGQKSVTNANLDQQKIDALRSGSLRKQADYILRVLQGN